MKSPAFSLYVRDWLCSKTVSKLHSQAYSKDGSQPCSRGYNAYMFLLCNSWLEHPPGTLPDNDDELIAMARVTPEEFAAIKPTLMLAFQKDTATGRLFNERLIHEANKQKARKLNGSKGGSKKVANLLANGVAALENENEGTDPNSVPDFAEAFAMTMNAAIPESFCRYVYDDWSLRGGKDGGGQQVPWLGYVCKRWSREKVTWANGTHKGNLSDKKQTGPAPVWRQIEALQKRIDAHPANPQSNSYFNDGKRLSYTPAQFEELKAMKAELRQMEASK